MKSHHNYFLLGMCLVMAFTTRCIRINSVAGGATGTEISACVVSGEIVDSCGNPVPNCVVRLRPNNYIAWVNTILPGKVQDDTTNGSGRFSMDGVPPGQYCIEVTSDDSLGQSVEMAVDSEESLKVLTPTVIQPMAVIYGNNLPLAIQGAPPYVRAIGFERSAPIDSTGHFEMKMVPGWCRLHLQGVDTNRYHGNTVVYAKAGKAYNVMPMPYSFTFCDSLACEMKIIQEILDSNALQSLTPESVMVVDSQHVTELLLRGRGIRVLPKSIGLLWRLQVLDVGKNYLYELPWEIGFLRKLAVLRADSNNSQWFSVPASIGMLSSLIELDLSNSRITSLPPTITYLTPTKHLNLDRNSLCNIGNSTELWANQYAFGWRERQYCR
jgi:hypothetical protein